MTETRHHGCSSIYDLLAHWGPTGLMMSYLPLPELLPFRVSSTATANSVNIHLRGLLQEELLLAISSAYKRNLGLRYCIYPPAKDAVPPESWLKPERADSSLAEPFIFVVDVASALPLRVMHRCDVAGLIFLLKTSTMWVHPRSEGEAGADDENNLSSVSEATSTVKVRREFADNLLQSVVELAEIRNCSDPGTANVGEGDEQPTGVVTGKRRKTKKAKEQASGNVATNESDGRIASKGTEEANRGSIAIADIILWPRSCPVYQLLSHWGSKKRFGFKGERSKPRKHRGAPSQETPSLVDDLSAHGGGDGGANAKHRLQGNLLVEKVINDFAPLFQVREIKKKKKRKSEGKLEGSCEDDGETVSAWLGRPTPDIHDVGYLLGAISDSRDRIPPKDSAAAGESSPLTTGSEAASIAPSAEATVVETPLARHDSRESNDGLLPATETESHGTAFIETTEQTDSAAPPAPPPGHDARQDHFLDLESVECPRFLCRTGTFVMSARRFTGNNMNPVALLANVSSIYVCHVPNLERIGNGFLANRAALLTIVLAHLPNLAGIGERFLQQCTALRSMHIVDCPALTVLGAHFLESAIALCSWTLPTSITGVGGSFLESCSALRGVNLAHMKIAALGSGSLAFTSMLSIQFPKSLKFIGDGVLAASNLRLIDLRHTLCVSIGGSFLANSAALEKIELPETLAGIGPKFLLGCIKIRQLDLTRTQLRMVGDDFCGGASRLESVKFPSTLIRLPQDVFSRLVRLGGAPMIDFSTTSIPTAVIPNDILGRFILPPGFKNGFIEGQRQLRQDSGSDSEGES